MPMLISLKRRSSYTGASLAAYYMADSDLTDG